jgi:hypothetical protein
MILITGSPRQDVYFGGDAAAVRVGRGWKRCRRGPVEGDRTVGGGGEEEIEGTGGAGRPGHGQQAGEYLYGTNHHAGERFKIWVTFFNLLSPVFVQIGLSDRDGVTFPGSTNAALYEKVIIVN